MSPVLYTDAEQWGENAPACIYPEATGTHVRSWCGHETHTDYLTSCATLAPTLADFLRQRSPHVCETCVNEMARAMNLPAGQRIKWVEEYAGGALAPYIHEQAGDG